MQVALVLFIPVLTLTALIPLFPGFAVYTMISAIALLILYIFIPNKSSSNLKIHDNHQRIDERDALFHRFYRLQKNSAEWKSYYKKHPDKESHDKKLRDMPDLQEPGCKTYNAQTSPFCLALFDTIDRLNKNLNDLPPNPIESSPVQTDALTISNRLKGFAKHLGADVVGCTQLNQAHVYSHRARGEGKWGDEINLEHGWAMVIGVQMSHSMMSTAPGNPVITESSACYLEAAKIATAISNYLLRLGYEARAHIDGNYQLACIPVAVDAGLGELGRHGLLIHPEHGSMLRLAVVTTTLELVQDSPVQFGVQDFCTICKKCAENCPSAAVDQHEKEFRNGIEKWQTDQDACYRFWRQMGTDCGLCLLVCPYSHPNTLMHSMIRRLLIHNKILNKPALLLDDLIYGRKRKKQKDRIPEWHR